MNGTKYGNGRSLGAWLAIAVIGLSCGIAGGADPRDLEHQTREFQVSVDGKPRGKCTMQIRRREDGADTVRIKAALSFNFVVYEYRYSSTGTEVWKNGRLIELENAADYNGKKYSVKAKAEKKGLRVTVNDKPFDAEPDVWVTSYWRLPDHLAQAGDAGRKAAGGHGVVPAGGVRAPRRAAKTTVSLLDSDKGRPLKGEVQCIGEETVTVAGKKKTCTHYKIAGDVEVEVWYDGDQRLVRQQTVEEGHKTLMELTRVAAE